MSTHARANDPATESAPQPVRIETGLVRGASHETGPDVRVFKGIPFAAPPVGALRWRRPQPAAAWEGVRDCAEFGAACPQPARPVGSIYGGDPENQNEDCLTLNVWTTAKPGEKLPVMIWIHGGAFTRGTGSNPFYDGAKIARQGVVLVTINYRLGIFGFFAHPELSAEDANDSSGNYALLDQIAGLEWVKRNIAAFGGDPENVTIFGESAGGWSVTYLMASPLSHGLYQRAIAESGAAVGPARSLREVWEGQESMEQTGERIARALGCDGGGANSGDGGVGVLAFLRSKSAAELLAVMDEAPVGPGNAGMHYGPVVDGWVVPKDPHTIFQNGEQAPVPLLLGSNADEGSTFIEATPEPDMERYTAGIDKRYGRLAGAFHEAYPVTDASEINAVRTKSYGDAIFCAATREAARLVRDSGQPVYLYYFTRVRPGAWAKTLGAYHAAEIGYIFGTFAPGKNLGLDETDYALSDQLNKYWTNFAKTGDPNGDGLPAWPLLGAGNSKDNYLEFGDVVEVKSQFREKECDFWGMYYGWK